MTTLFILLSSSSQHEGGLAMIAIIVLALISFAIASYCLNERRFLRGVVLITTMLILSSGVWHISEITCIGAYFGIVFGTIIGIGIHIFE